MRALTFALGVGHGSQSLTFWGLNIVSSYGKERSSTDPDNLVNVEMTLRDISGKQCYGKCT